MVSKGVSMKLLIIIPCFNEEKTIAKVISAVPKRLLELMK